MTPLQTQNAVAGGVVQGGLSLAFLVGAGLLLWNHPVGFIGVLLFAALVIFLLYQVGKVLVRIQDWEARQEPKRIARKQARRERADRFWQKLGLKKSPPWDVMACIYIVVLLAFGTAGGAAMDTLVHYGYKTAAGWMFSGLVFVGLVVICGFFFDLFPLHDRREPSREQHIVLSMPRQSSQKMVMIALTFIVAICILATIAG